MPSYVDMVQSLLLKIVNNKYNNKYFLTQTHILQP